MPAAGMKKYIVVAAPGASNQTKGMHTWKQKTPGTKEDESTGDQVYVEVGTEVFLTPEAAQPLIDIGRLRPAAEA